MIAFDIDLTVAVPAVAVLISVITAGHVVLNKRDSRAALLWVGLVSFAPIVGAILYTVFGVNRVRRRARRIRTGRLTARTDRTRLEAAKSAEFADRHGQLAGLCALVGRVVERPLLGGNAVEPLVAGEEAFPAMWAAIEQAEHSITLASYLFDRDQVGLGFVERLAAAVQRGVEVRVLVDDAGARYSFPTVFRSLAEAGVPHAAFHPRNRMLLKSTLNIRNHRKICVVDGHTAFTGGMNIHRGHLLEEAGDRGVQDVHFRVRGPVVQQIQEIFAEDWFFVSGEDLCGDKWFHEVESQGGVFARIVPEGPDSDLHKMRWAILGAIGAARHSIKIVTPYFLPDPPVIAALNVASLRGVEVDIILPARPNVKLVEWAVMGTLWQVTEFGCRVWLTPEPFDHSKLMVIDSAWTFVGSANWDPRSFRLNFELNLECYDDEFAGIVETIVDRKRELATSISFSELAARPLWKRLRDSVARLMSPLL